MGDASATEPPAPWQGFLRDVDALLDAPLELHCLGGFVVAQAYGAGRATADHDVLSIRPRGSVDIDRIAGLGSALHRRHRLYLQHVGIVTPPSDYLGRLRAFATAAPWRHLRLYALDPIDLALTKVERAAEVDRRDVVELARAGWLDANVLRRRYEEEVAPYLLVRTPRHDDTVELYARLVEAVAEETGGSRRR